MLPKIDKPSKALEAFLNEADISPNSLSVYRRVLISYFKYLNINKLEFNKLEKKDFINWKNQFIKSHEPKTLNMYQSVLRRFYKYLSEYGACSNITLGVRLAKLEKNYCKYPLSKDQVNELLDSIGDKKLNARRDHALINLMVLTGLRRIEINRLDIGDLTLIQDKPALRIQRKGHTSKDQFKVISIELAEELKSLISYRDNYLDSDPLFMAMPIGKAPFRLGTKSISQIVKKHMERIGLTGKFYTAHSLRHTTAVLLLSNGFDLHYTMVYMGHTSTNTTQVYAKYINDVMAHSQNGINTIQNILKK